ncbi:MAG: NAD(P)/FAD-dependent oxidoreductase [Oscillospiraceae bacterium]
MVSVVIIGGGICGCSLLYELSRYQISALLLEKENDVSVGTTKANSAIIHAGYDPIPGTKMAKYNVEGNAIIKELCKNLDVPYKQVGSLVIALNDDQKETLQVLYEQGLKNAVPNLQLLSAKEALELEPNLNPDVKAALFAPSAGIVSPWNLAIALAETAVTNGAEVKLNSKVLSIKKTNHYFTIETTQGTIEAEYVINAAGVLADEVNDMVDKHRFTVTPSRGEYHLLDKNQGNLVSHIILQCPDHNGKGVLVAPTVDGNLIVGPNAEPSPKNDVSTTSIGLDYVKNLAVKSVPSINFRESIRNFSGLRALTQEEDFIIGESNTQPGFFNFSGMKSPGLSSAPAIARDLVTMLHNAGLELTKKPTFIDKRNVVRFKHHSDTERTDAIKQNPLYGTIVCRCETITEGEIVDALHRPIAPCSIDGVKRRCGAGMGRCQGGFCSPRVQQIIARELNIPLSQVPLDRLGMDIITGVTKEDSKNV